jgi:signal transduction histidine kinase
MAMALSAVLVAALWLLTHATIERTSRAALERAVDVDLAGLVDIYASGGERELVRRIADRLALESSEGNAAHYMLAREDGRRIAGDIGEWPALDPRLSEAGEVKLPGGAEAQGRATQLGPDLRLVVIRERGDTATLLWRVGLVFLGGGAALVLAVGLLGRGAALSLSRRIGRINRAFRDPETERIDALAAGNAEDEIDELTRHSAAALARQKRLVEAYRETSDQIAHEIRTPLMHLDNKLVKALKAGAGETAGQWLLEAREDLRRLVGMLESLLDIAASRARRGDRHGLAPVDLSSLVLRIGELYAASAEESGHAFSCSAAPGVTIEGEQTQLARIITNLLDNAFKYVPPGGSVALELAPGPVLTVRDDGPGIPADEREAVFRRFHRGSRNAGDTQGVGLGLALAAAIAERHGLAIRLADTPEGACFIVSGGSA